MVNGMWRRQDDNLDEPMASNEESGQEGERKEKMETKRNEKHVE